jgi:hypothetical protein
MAILDIDIDYFLNEIPYNDFDGEGRKDSENYKIWDKKLFIEFLENKCGLSKEKRIRGRIIENHNEAFFYWRELIGNQVINKPFKIIHIDAHADLSYLPDGSFKYITDKYLSKDHQEMIYPERLVDYGKYEKFDSSNYLLYALACGWLREMDYVIHPKLEELDVPQFLTEKIGDSRFCLCLKNGQNDTKYNSKNICIENVICNDLLINVIGKENFKCSDNIDCVTVARSPQFTPRESDELVSIISNYLLLE